MKCYDSITQSADMATLLDTILLYKCFIYFSLNELIYGCWAFSFVFLNHQVIILTAWENKSLHSFFLHIHIYLYSPVFERKIISFWSL